MSATFLDVLWPNRPDLFGEIRAIKDRTVRQTFVQLDDWRGSYAEKLAAEFSAKGFDVYFGVLPRTRLDGTAEAVRDESDILWADIDPGFLGLSVHKRLADVKVTPQIIVDSGHGLHAYWLLDRSVEWDYAQVLMRGIARVVGGDAVYDKPRVLRLPGTLNYKREPFVEARVLRFDLARTYKPGDFDDLVIVDRKDPRPPAKFLPIDELPKWLLDLIKEGAPVGERSEASFKVVLWLIRYGRTDEEIEAIFESTPDGIGEKYDEKGRAGHRWLAYTIKAARERA